MLGQVGEQNCQVEPDGLGWVVVRLHEFDVVNLALVVCLGVAAHQEENLLAVTLFRIAIFVSAESSGPTWYISLISPVEF